jgi:hypothetical protein
MGSILSTLPARYLRALIRPTTETYSEGIADMNWAVVWIQLLVLTVLNGLLTLVPHAKVATTTASHVASTSPLNNPIEQFLLVPLFFFVFMGLMFVIAKAFHGKGTFLQLCSASLLYQVPIVLASNVSILLPQIGSTLNSVLSIYGIVLQVVAVMAAQRMGRRPATLIVILSLLSLLIVGVAAYTLLIITILR